MIRNAGGCVREALKKAGIIDDSIPDWVETLDTIKEVFEKHNLSMEFLDNVLIREDGTYTVQRYVPKVSLPVIAVAILGDGVADEDGLPICHAEYIQDEEGLSALSKYGQLFMAAGIPN